MPTNIHVPVPKRLQVTPAMVDDFMVDPVFAARYLLDIQFDAFQAAAFRISWWTPNVIDESGFGTGKSLRIWALMQLRAMLIPEQWVCAYYQTFDAGKKIFWPQYESRFAANPYFRAQLGKVDMEGEKSGKANTHGASCFIQHFRNGSRVMMPAPNWMQNAIGEAGITLSMAGIDEWTKVETMGKKQGQSTTVNQDGSVTGGINQQILGRLRRENFNQHHMLWSNRVIFSATAESTSHPSQYRVNQFRREIEKGNPDYAIISFCFKDASNLPSHTGKPFKEQIIDWKTISRMHTQFTPSHFRRECLGIRSRETAGWYSEDAVDACAKVGAKNGLEPEIGRGSAMHPELPHVFYFAGVDPAAARTKDADDGGLAVLRVRPKPGVTELTANESDWLKEYVWAYRLRKATARQWSGFIHKKHRDFGFSGVCMDAGGGGIWVNDELILPRQVIEGIETMVTPIASIEDLNRTGPNVQQLLTMYRRRDPGMKMLWPHLAGDDNLVEAMHLVFQEAVTRQEVSFPKPFNERPGEETCGWPEEKQWALKNLDAARAQLVDIQVAMNGDGTYQMTGHNAKQFAAGGMKDLAYACIYAYVRFLVWLKTGAAQLASGDEGSGYYVMTT